MQIRILLFAILTLCFNASMAQSQAKVCNHVFSGRVLDAETQSGLAGVALTIDGSRQLVTDSKGHFNARNLCPDSILLEIQFAGYETWKGKVKSNQTGQIFYLNRQAHHLDEVHVTGQKMGLKGIASGSSIQGLALEQSRGALLAEALKAIPGVNMLQTGATIAKPVIQGLHSNRILVLNNGIRQEGQQWGSEHAPEIDPFIANQLTVIKGAESIRFGAEAMGGVVLVEPAALPREAGLHGQMNLAGSRNGGTGIVSGMLNGGLKQLPSLGWRLQATGKKSGNIKTADYYLNNTGTKEFNFSGALGYAGQHFDSELYFSRFNTEIGIFSGAHIGNMDDLLAHIANGRPFETGYFDYKIGAPRQEINHSLLKLKSHFHLKNNAHLNFTYGLQQNNRKEFDLRRGDRKDLPSLDLALSTQTADLSLEQLNTSGWKKTLGLNALVQVNNNVPGTMVTPLIPNYDTYGTGAYLVIKRIKNFYELEGGIRYDHKYLDAAGYTSDKQLYGGTHSFNNVSASMGGVWHLNNQWDIRSNLGTAWRPPVVSELYSNGLHHGTASYEKGDPTLKTEQGYKWINSVEYRSDKLQFQLDAYANIIDNYIYLKPSGELFESIRGIFPVFDYTQTRARFLGADVSATYAISKAFEYQLKASTTKAKDIDQNNYLPWIPADQIDQGIRWKASKAGTFLQLNYQFTGRQNRYNLQSDYTVPPPAYHLINLNGASQWKINQHTLLLSFTIQNLTNTLYKDYMNRFRFYAHDMGRNITLRASWQF